MRIRLAAVAAVMAGSFGTVPMAIADNFFELEHARANARAGGPVSERDAELLDRYGALSGTGNWRARAPAPYNYTSPTPTVKSDRKRRRQY